jgi:hypothetical protein
MGNGLDAAVISHLQQCIVLVGKHEDGRALEVLSATGFHKRRLSLLHARRVRRVHHEHLPIRNTPRDALRQHPIVAPSPCILLT